MSVSEQSLHALPLKAARAGRALLRAGVVPATAVETLDGMTVVTGQVCDGDAATFRCWIGIEADRIDADCSCGARTACAHVAAVLLAASGAEGVSSVEGGPGPGEAMLVTPGPSATRAPNGEFVMVLDLHRSPSDGDRLVLSAVRRSRVNGRWIETAYALARARESRQPGYLGARSLDFLRRALADGTLVDDGLRVRFDAPIDWLPALLESVDCCWRAAAGVRMRLTGWRAVNGHWRARADGAQCFEVRCPEGPGVVLPGMPPLVLDPDSGVCVGVHARGATAELSAWLQGQGWVAPDQVAAVRKAVRARAGTPEERLLPALREVIDLDQREPQPVLVLDGGPAGPDGDAPAQGWAVAVFDYGPARLPADGAVDTALLDAGSGRVGRVRRDLPGEYEALAALRPWHLEPLTGTEGRAGRLGYPAARRAEEPWARLQRASAELAGSGWRLGIEPGFPYRLVEPEHWYGWVERGDAGVFELDLGAELDGRRWSLLDPLLAWLDQVPAGWLKRLLDTGDPDDGLLLRLDATRLVRLPARQVRAALLGLVEWTGRGALDKGRLRLPLARLAGLTGLEQHWAVDGAPELTGLLRSLRDLDSLDAIAPPEGLQATLRDYQRRGLAWLQLLREHGFGGVLADDMGLGKTLQTLAHLLVEKQAGRMDRPCLIVAPASLLFNWRAEARRFAPALRVLTLHGPERKARFARIPDHDVLLTSYALLVRDRRRLAAHAFHVVVLDEAQAIKNPRSATARCARELSARQRLALTGTPLENHLGECWSLFEFVQPGLLGSAARFERAFRRPIEREHDRGRLKLLRHTIAPFLLRRTKTAVAPELPPVVDIERAIELEPGQQQVYEAVRLAMHEKVRGALDRCGAGRERIVVLDALLRLRQVCCDPRLVDRQQAPASGRAGSAKLAALLDMLRSLCAEGRQVLVFSQFTSMLKLIETEVRRPGLDYVTLTGQTRDRARAVAQFQKGQARVFLISLKAGGTGLNLTAADAVIHYDPWWNPAAEDQATGRAHRIGQTRQVFSWRLVTVGTVEQRVLELQRRKRELVDGLLTGAGGFRLEDDDIEALFAPLGEGA